MGGCPGVMGAFSGGFFRLGWAVLCVDFDFALVWAGFFFAVACAVVCFGLCSV